MVLRIWIINQYALTPQQAGGTRHYTLAKRMLDLGVETTVIASSVHYLTRKDAQAEHREEVRQETHDGVNFCWLKTPTFEGNGAGRFLNMLSFAWKALRFGGSAPRSGLPRPDIILGSSPHLFGAFTGWLLSRRYRVPFVLEVRDIWPKSMVILLGMRPSHPAIRLLARLERFLYERADLIVSLLQGVGRHALEVTARAAPVVWIPNGVLLDAVPPVPAQVSQVFTVMYTGAHGVPNSLHTALEAAHLLQQAGHQHVRFVFVGEGVQKSELQAQAARLGLKNVEFRPPVSKAEIPQLLAQADAFLLLFRNTPLYQDGLSPNKTFDYLSAGRPILMAVDSPFDPVSEAGAGLSIPPENPHALADAVLRLASLPLAERQAMGERGRAYVAEHHDMRVLARKLANVLHVVAGRRG